jgi:hypothetical protein
MTNNAEKITSEHPLYQEWRLKELLGEACMDIAKWKSKYEASEKRVAELEKQIRQMEVTAGVVRLPFSRAVCR